MARGQSLQDPFLNALRKERVPGLDLPGQWHQAAGSDRLLRPVRRPAEEHGEPDGLQARHLHGRSGARTCASRRPKAPRKKRRSRRPSDRGSGRNPCSSGLSAVNARYSCASGSAPADAEELGEFDAARALRGRDTRRDGHRPPRAARIRATSSAAARRKKSATAPRPSPPTSSSWIIELSPSQERNLEKLVGRRVLDRAGLILDIFAQRARSVEGKLEVELAQLKHLSTRLVRGWTHLERQKGGIGLRGPGETQLETDRRLVGKRVRTLTQRSSRSFASSARHGRGSARKRVPVPARRARRLHQRREVDAVHGR